MSSRNILIIVMVVVLVAILGIGFYFLLLSPKSIPATTQTGQTGALPDAGNQSNTPPPTDTNLATGSGAVLGKNFGIISNEPALDYFVSPTNVVTAIEPTGKIIQVTNGQVAVINSVLVQDIISASFSYDGAKILVNFGDRNNPQTSIFDVASKAWTPVSQTLISPVWSPSDYRIAYTASGANGTETFATIDISKTKPAPVTLTTLHTQALSIAWPDKTQLVLYTKPTSYGAGSALLFDLQKNTMTPIASEVSGLEMLLSGTSLGLAAPMELEFATGPSGLGGGIALTDIAGNITQQLKFSTLPSKCLFSSTTSTVAMTASSSLSVTTTTPYLYCGVPRDQNGFSFAHLPDDYLQMALFTSDDIYRINLQSGVISAVFNDQSQNLDVSDVKFFNNTLFFVNRYDQKLYAISISA